MFRMLRKWKVSEDDEHGLHAVISSISVAFQIRERVPVKTGRDDEATHRIRDRADEAPNEDCESDEDE